jgi:hypothetical protein
VVQSKTRISESAECCASQSVVTRTSFKVCVLFVIEVSRRLVLTVYLTGYGDDNIACVVGLLEQLTLNKIYGKRYGIL